MPEKIRKTEEEWKELLTPEQYSILREKGTELPDSGKFYQFDEAGVYVCVACGNLLFRSDTKFDSGSGWPSFWAPVTDDALDTAPDVSPEGEKTEVMCARCGGHVGHVFDDGPKPTGLRYCINSVSLDFVSAGETAEGKAAPEKTAAG
jgi:peptide-methionine (R)-S-oxide reductase